MTGYTARQQDASCLMNGTEGTSLFLMSGISNSSEVLRLRFFSLFDFKAKTHVGLPASVPIPSASCISKYQYEYFHVSVPVLLM